MSEPAIDLSELIGLYKEDARKTVAKMKENFARWQEYKSGGTARAELRRMSHQLRGSGRTYGFRQVTRICKAIENITIKVENGKLQADEAVRRSVAKKIELLASVMEF